MICIDYWFAYDKIKINSAMSQFCFVPRRNILKRFMWAYHRKFLIIVAFTVFVGIYHNNPTLSKVYRLYLSENYLSWFWEFSILEKTRLSICKKMEDHGCVFKINDPLVYYRLKSMFFYYRIIHWLQLLKDHCLQAIMPEAIALGCSKHFAIFRNPRMEKASDFWYCVRYYTTYIWSVILTS